MQTGGDTSLELGQFHLRAIALSFHVFLVDYTPRLVWMENDIQSLSLHKPLFNKVLPRPERYNFIIQLESDKFPSRGK